MGKPVKVCREEPTKCSRWIFLSLQLLRKNSRFSVTRTRSWGEDTPKSFFVRMCGPNVDHISDQRLRVFILLFRPEPKISTPFQISKISTRLLYVSAVNRNWVPFAWTFEMGYKFTDVDAEKIVPCWENKIPNAKPEGKAYSFSDQNGEILCAFSDRENKIPNHAQARGKSIPYFRPKW